MSTKLGLIWGGSFVGKYANAPLSIWVGDLFQVRFSRKNPDDPWDERCIYLHENQTKIPKVGRYTVRPMDPMGYLVLHLDICDKLPIIILPANSL